MKRRRAGRLTLLSHARLRRCRRRRLTCIAGEDTWRRTSLLFLILALNSFNSVPALPTHVADMKVTPRPHSPTHAKCART